MTKILLVCLFVCACSILQAQTNIITTIAGNDTAGYSGDGGYAGSSKLNSPEAICLDRFSNIIIADAANNRIRKLDATTNIITTIAGNGIGGYNGDNIPATDAQLFIPDAVCADSLGNIYIADAINSRIRKIVSSTGLITTICGTGISGNSGDGGLATNARIDGPTGICMDKDGNIFIADILSNNLRKIHKISGIISTIAGTGVAGFSGDGGPATLAKLSQPGNVFVDESGNIFFTELSNNVIRKVSPAGIITTVAGNGFSGYTGDNGPALSARLNQPCGIFIDRSNNIYFSDWGNGVIRRIDGASQIITTVVGCGVQGYSGDGGAATDAKLQPNGLWLDDYGTMYIADITNNRIRKVYNPKLNVNSAIAISRTSIFPNPATDLVTIEYNFGNQSEGILQVADITGRCVLSHKLAAGKEKEMVDVSTLPQGIYLYKVLDQGMVVAAGKLVKQ